MQATLFKFQFRSLNPGETPHYEYLFQKEEADRKREQEALKKRIREAKKRDRERRKAILRERQELIQQERERGRQQRVQIKSRKYEGQEIIPGLYLGGRLAAMNSEWMASVQYPPDDAPDVPPPVSIESEIKHMIELSNHSAEGGGDQQHAPPPTNPRSQRTAGGFRPLSHVLNVSDSVPNYYSMHPPNSHEEIMHPVVPSLRDDDDKEAGEEDEDEDDDDQGDVSAQGEGEDGCGDGDTTKKHSNSDAEHRQDQKNETNGGGDDVDDDAMDVDTPFTGGDYDDGEKNDEDDSDDLDDLDDELNGAGSASDVDDDDDDQVDDNASTRANPPSGAPSIHEGSVREDSMDVDIDCSDSASTTGSGNGAAAATSAAQTTPASNDDGDDDGGLGDNVNANNKSVPADDSTTTPTASETKSKKKSKKAAKNRPLKPLIYKRIVVEDSRDVDLASYFEPAVAFISGALSSGGAVLVHCREGRSRSVTIVLAYLMMEKKWTLRQAFDHVAERSPDHNINDGFMKQLMRLEHAVHRHHTLDFFDRSDRKGKINYNEQVLEYQYAQAMADEMGMEIIPDQPKRRRKNRSADGKRTAPPMPDKRPLDSFLGPAKPVPESLQPNCNAEPQSDAAVVAVATTESLTTETESQVEKQPSANTNDALPANGVTSTTVTTIVKENSQQQQQPTHTPMDMVGAAESPNNPPEQEQQQQPEPAVEAAAAAENPTPKPAAKAVQSSPTKKKLKKKEPPKVTLLNFFKKANS